MASRRPDLGPAARERLTFLRHWARRPLRMGSVTPSGPALGRAMADAALTGLDDDRHIVEIGAGTGAITRAVLAAGVPASRLVPVEIDADLHAHLVTAFPDVRPLHGDAAHLGPLLQACGVGPVGAVVSGLPLLALPAPLVEAIVTAVIDVLPSGGRFVQFTYGPSSPVPQALVDRLALTATRSARLWANLPPAVVWTFVKP